MNLLLSKLDLNPQMHWRPILFGCLVICAVSVHDAMLVVVNSETIAEMEQNPVGLWLLSLSGGDVWLFVSVKLVCTACVCTAVVMLFRYWQTAAFVTVSSLAAFQLLLLCYLTAF